MRVLALKSCDTCRKALAALRAAGHDPQVIDVADGIPPADLAAILAVHGDGALNRASTTWRALPEGERVWPAADLLAEHPKLMKRPMIDTGETWLKGWTPEVRAALGL